MTKKKAAATPAKPAKEETAKAKPAAAGKAAAPAKTASKAATPKAPTKAAGKENGNEAAATKAGKVEKAGKVAASGKPAESKSRTAAKVAKPAAGKGGKVAKGPEVDDDRGEDDELPRRGLKVVKGSKDDGDDDFDDADLEAVGDDLGLDDDDDSEGEGAPRKPGKDDGKEQARDKDDFEDVTEMGGPAEVVSPDQIDDVMSMFGEREAPIVESTDVQATDGESSGKGVLPIPPAPDDVEAEKEEKEEDPEPGRSNDPVRMYLRKMGAVSLLTREGEVEIARRIETGENKVFEVILSSRVGLSEVIELGEKLKKALQHAKQQAATHEAPNSEDVNLKKSKYLERIKELEELIKQEDNVIHQTGIALERCLTDSLFTGSSEHIECNRILLISCRFI
jgi:RNA polymerase primary sigma factor